MKIEGPSITSRDKHAKGIISCAWFPLKRISSTHSLSILAMLHICLFMCVFSSHVTFHTCTILMYVVVCFYVSHNSFPDFVRKRPRMHPGCLFLREDRRWRMPLASPLVSPFLVKRRFGSAAWPPNETAKLIQRSLEEFYSSDRRFSTAERNRRSDLGDLFSRSCFGGLIGGSETAE